MVLRSSSRTPVLAVLYRDGILYYFFTLSLFIFATLVSLFPRLPYSRCNSFHQSWRYMSYGYFGLPLYLTWILSQMAMSRLLLNIKSSQAFQQRTRTRPCHRTTASGNALPLVFNPTRSNPDNTLKVLSRSQSNNDSTRTSELVRPRLNSLGDGESVSTKYHTSFGLGGTEDGNGVVEVHQTHQKSNSVGLDVVVNEIYGEGSEVRHVEGTVGRSRSRLKRENKNTAMASLRRSMATPAGAPTRAWFWFTRQAPDMHIDVDPVDEEYWGWEDEGGLKVSRLGRFDHWL